MSTRRFSHVSLETLDLTMLRPSFSAILSALEERAKRAGAKACEDSVQVHDGDGKGARRGMSKQANCKSKLEEGLLVSVNSPTGGQQRKPLAQRREPAPRL